MVEVVLGHALGVGGDGGALHCHAILLGGLGGLHCDLVVGLVALFEAQVVVFGLEVDEGEDEFVLDHLPQDAGHFVAVHFHQRGGHLYLVHGIGVFFEFVGTHGSCVRLGKTV